MFNANVRDQFTPSNVITNEAVHWAVTAGAGSLSVANSSFTTFTAGNTVNSYTLTASSYSATATATINVVANTSGRWNPGEPPANTRSERHAATTVMLVTNPLGTTITPTITWSVAGCAGSSISNGGLLTAGNTLGTCTVSRGNDSVWRYGQCVCDHHA